MICYLCKVACDERFRPLAKPPIDWVPTPATILPRRAKALTDALDGPLCACTACAPEAQLRPGEIDDFAFRAGLREYRFVDVESFVATERKPTWFWAVVEDRALIAKFKRELADARIDRYMMDRFGVMVSWNASHRPTLIVIGGLR